LARWLIEVSWLGALTIDNPQEVAQLAEFGVVFLLFMIGLDAVVGAACPADAPRTSLAGRVSGRESG
jgi:hypothetical protein